MERQRIAMIAVAVGFLLSAVSASAQAPAGVGADGAAQSSSTPHSYNPIKWVKKDSHTTNASADANTVRNAKLTSRLQMQGLLATDASLDDTCSAMKGLGECVAALHVGRNLGLDFSCLKWKLTGIQGSAKISSCMTSSSGKAMTLVQAIHTLKPGANAAKEAKNAERQSAADLREARS